MFEPRPKQKAVLEYTGGKMGVAAVPGSGKTRTLSFLAAKLITSGRLADDQEVLIVTLVNSAVDNFARQVGGFVKEMGLLPNFGYRVRTLHGLANDIVRERPGLVGLEEGFQIIDERDSDAILDDAARAWARANPNVLGQYLSPEVSDKEYMRLQNSDWPNEVKSVAGSFIKQAKDMQLTPDDVRRYLDRFEDSLPLAEMGWQIYVGYQRGLRYRGAVDFQDLIRLALKALELDPEYLNRLRHRWPYILEDEAQDSSLLQEKILRLLSEPAVNWVRMGDPNQAIYETFTTARPEYLRDFLQEKGVKARELPNSGRSTKSVIKLANELIEWSQNRHPVQAVRDRAPLQPPKILPTPKGDPQPNPKDDKRMIFIRPENYSPAGEIEAIVKSLVQWLPENQDKTVAVLVPRNERGSELVRALQEKNIEVVELLRSTSATRRTAGALALILEHLSQPVNPPSLSSVYRVWRRDDRENTELQPRLQAVARLLRGVKRVEAFVWPQLDEDWLDTDPDAQELFETDPQAREQLQAFRHLLRRWQSAVILPIDQLTLTIAQDVFHDTVDLAIAHSLALTLQNDQNSNPGWRLPEFEAELKKVAKNRRRVVGLSDDDTGFDPDHHKGKVTVSTMHRAKGLEWDRVYLMSVNNYDFPSGEPQDTYIGEKWFVRDNLNLEAEALAQLKAAAETLTFEYEEGQATRGARLDYVSERLRLLYVGITRARRELIVTWNTGRDGKRMQATPLIALQVFWEKQNA